ncbi:MAG: glycosyltransferase [Planctomycetes bacterium]|nr:glycosyltransferase [Planctomycetota bacterium]
MRVALVHDWLTGMRGGEKVLEVLCALFPRAELFTLVHVRGSVSPVIERHRIHRSFVSALPYVRRLYRHYLPLFPIAVELFDLDQFDLVLSTSHCAVKSVITGGHARHLCYCLTPMRYAWDQFDAYFGPGRIGRMPSSLMKPIIGALARWDAGTSGRPDRYVAISQYVASRIRRYYNRGAGVIYPPVDTGFYCPDATQRDGTALIVSALVPYKRVDLAVEACQRVGVTLRIVGQGPEKARLRQLAGPRVEFLGTVSDEEVRACYRRASVVLLPGEEDFGIVPLEAQACGRPVVALGRGGALETVVDGVTGVLVADSSVGALADGLARALETPFDASAIRRHAESFGRERFAAEMGAAVAEILKRPTDSLPW